MLIAYICTFFYIVMSLMVFHEESKVVIRRGSLKNYLKNMNIGEYMILTGLPLTFILLVLCYFNVDSRKNKEPVLNILKVKFNKFINFKPFKD